MLHGHGRRSRQLRGPAAPDGSPELRCVWVQRFRCKKCKATATVAPRETLTKRLFTAPAIALALALFGVAALSEREVRERVSPWAVVGATASSGWCTLPRWAEAIRERRLFRVRRTPADWSPRQVAARAATTLAAAAPEKGAGIPGAAFYGALTG